MSRGAWPTPELRNWLVSDCAYVSQAVEFFLTIKFETRRQAGAGYEDPYNIDKLKSEHRHECSLLSNEFIKHCHLHIHLESSKKELCYLESKFYFDPYLRGL